MNCLPYVSTGVLLLAIAGGVALLMKAQKDGLNNVYKGIAYGIIVVAFLALACCLVRCAVGSCGGNSCGGNDGYKFRHGGCGGHGYNYSACCRWDDDFGHGGKKCKGKCSGKCKSHGDFEEEGGHRCGGHKRVEVKEWEEVVTDTTKK